MKLKSKLIPLVGLATASAIVSPLTLTSCGGTFTGKAVDLSKGFTPTIDAYKQCSMSVSDILDLYTEEIMNNPETFVQDFLWAKANTGLAYDPTMAAIQYSRVSSNMSQLTNAKFGASKTVYSKDIETISNVSVSKESPLVEGDTHEYPLLSFDMTSEEELSDVGGSLLAMALTPKEEGENPANYKITGNIKTSLSFSGVPMTFGVDEVGLLDLSIFPPGDMDPIMFTSEFLFLIPHSAWIKRIPPYEEAKTLKWAVKWDIEGGIYIQDILTGHVQTLSFDYDWSADEKSWSETPLYIGEWTPFNDFISPYFTHQINFIDEREN